jgi:hypothetical protein
LVAEAACLAVGLCLRAIPNVTAFPDTRVAAEKSAMAPVKRLTMIMKEWKGKEGKDWAQRENISF